MTSTSVEVPAELLELLGQSRARFSTDEEHVRAALAVHLFITHQVSIGRAAELAGLPYLDFEQMLRDLDLPVVFYGEAEYAADMKTIEELERRSKA